MSTSSVVVSRGLRLWAVLLAWIVLLGPATARGDAPAFVVSFNPAVFDATFSDRVYVVLTDGSRDARDAIRDWFRPPQIFAVDAARAGPAAPARLGTASLSFPKAWADLPPGTYSATALVRRDRDAAVPGQGAGDVFSESVRINWPLERDVRLALTEVVKATAPADSERVRYVEIRSNLLSAFHGRPVTVRAGVRLPKNWSAEAAQRWPAVYFITGFGGDHRLAERLGRLLPAEADDALLIVPDATNYYGHSVFADSANCGPWGRVLIEEIIPAVEERFGGPGARGGGGAAQRYVTGVSSGGWSSLWLQVNYPGAFAGCWSLVPDPVDFTDFQRIDLYAPGANMYRDPAGERRPLARFGERVSLFYDEFVRMETVLGPGGQIGSFEAVFSPREADGQPRPLFNRATGAIDPVTADAWRAYDLNLVLPARWAKIGSALAGKIHVYAGGDDTFYLDGAARKLAATMARLDPQAVVTIVPGLAHAPHPPALKELFETVRARAAEHAGALPSP